MPTLIINLALVAVSRLGHRRPGMKHCFPTSIGQWLWEVHQEQAWLWPLLTACRDPHAIFQTKHMFDVSAMAQSNRLDSHP
jgi:hypothetical protein